MEKKTIENLNVVKIGILLSLLTLLFGYGLGGAFGAKEHDIKEHLKEKAQKVLSTVYKGDKAKMNKIIKKSWVYFKRAHLHANGLGTTALVLIILVSFLPASDKLKLINSLLLGIGSFGYSTFWMFAALRAPAMGSTGMAKESLKFLAIPSAGCNIVGLIMVIALIIMALFVNREE